jgi:hypothetical protein
MVSVRVYDLGLTGSDISILRNRFPEITLLPFDYSRHPPYFNIALHDGTGGHYAWKPAIIREVVESCTRQRAEQQRVQRGGGSSSSSSSSSSAPVDCPALPAVSTVLWLDSACQVNTSGLGGIHREIIAKGLYSPISAGCVQQWTHPLTLTALEEDGTLLPPNSRSQGGREADDAGSLCGAARDGEARGGDGTVANNDSAAASGATAGRYTAADLRPRLNRNAAVVGFSLDDLPALNLLNEWDRLCHCRQVVAPQGSDRSNHRQDQAVLTLLFYAMGWFEVYAIDEGEGTEQSVSLYNT